MSRQWLSTAGIALGDKNHREMLIHTACAIICKYRNDRESREETRELLAGPHGLRCERLLSEGMKSWSSTALPVLLSGTARWKAFTYWDTPINVQRFLTKIKTDDKKEEKYELHGE